MRFLIDHINPVRACDSKKYLIISLMINSILAGNLYFSQIGISAKYYAQYGLIAARSGMVN